MQTLEIIQVVNGVLMALFVLCCGYQFIYLALPSVMKDSPPAARPRTRRYAVLICARNERAVLPLLLQSIGEQDYPAHLVQTFVLADNCDDDTAQVARQCGAIVYERQDSQHVGKGYALDWLLQAVWRDHGPFDGYFNFDADNILCRDYISRMNDAFGPGREVLTSYRNTKNFADSWISAGSGLGYLREAETLNHARALLGTSCGISGTGWLISHRVLESLGGYPFHLLTDDFQCTYALVTAGWRIGYCKDAVLYDEQPVNLGQLYTQRLRWCKGYLQVYARYGGRLLRGMIAPPPAPRGETSRPWQRRLACYDMAMLNVPLGILVFLWTFTALAETAASATLLPLVRLLAASYGVPLLVGWVTVTTQWKRIQASARWKWRSMLAFPLLMMLWTPIYALAMFKRVQYVPTPHSAALTLNEIEHTPDKGGTPR